MANLEWRGLTLAEDLSAPQNSPRWLGAGGRVRVLLEHNTVANTWTAIVGVVGKPVTAAREGADRDAAITQALSDLLGTIDGPTTSRTASLVTADRNGVETVAARTGGVREA